MPIAPRDPFFKFTCKACGWSIVTYQASDAIHHPSTCPKCKGSELAFSKAGTVESMRTYPKEFIKWLTKTC